MATSTRRTKALGPMTDRAKSYLREFAEFGYGMSMTKFNETHGYGKVAHKRWCSDLDGFRDKFEGIQRSHSERTTAMGSTAKVLPPSHTEQLPVWQQNFLESWRRSKRRTEAAAKAKVSWAGVEHALDHDEDFRKAYDATKKEILVDVEDNLIIGALEGKINAVTRLLSTNEAQVKKDELDQNWWEDTSGVAESLGL